MCDHTTKLPGYLSVQSMNYFLRLATRSLLCIVCLTASLAFVPSQSLADEAPRPNIVLILVDDFGYECVGANGGTSYKTPHLDHLAAGGMRFERCYVQPLCTPTRVQLMTGQYNVRNYTHFGHLDVGQTTFAQLFQKAGYATAIAGKWQLGREMSLPAHFGFQKFCLWQLTRRPPRYANPGLEIDGREIDYNNGEYGPDVVNQYACDFITSHRQQPFLLYYPMMLTHAPFQPTPDSPDWDPKAMGEKAKDRAENFAGNVAYADKLIGKLIATLNENGLRQKTLVIVVGDNGTKLGHRSQMGARTVIGAKGRSIDRGMHVPLIVSQPGTVLAGSVSQDLVDSSDFLPTLCAAAGVDVPSSLPIDGQSFWPQLRGEKGTPRSWIYSWYAREGGAEAETEFAMTRRYKLYRSGEMYDILDDTDERHAIDVQPANPELVQAKQQLAGVLAKYRDVRPRAISEQGGVRERPRAKASG